MSETTKSRDMPWHVMQRNLAQAGADTGSYAIVRNVSQPHWKFMPTSGSWLSRARTEIRYARGR